MRYFRILFNTLISMLVSRFAFFEKKSLRSIDLSDLIKRDFQQFVDRDAMAGDFRSFSNTDDYNRDFLSMFQNFKKDFYLDYSQKDGHFRV
ncbi:MAG: hypothetical protein ACOX2W_14215 [Desulfomonilia bacterium]